MKKLWLICGLIWGLTGTVQARTDLRFDPDTVVIGESTQLILQSDRLIKQAPDLSVLADHFIVSGQQEETTTTTINGRTRRVHNLIYNVFPRHTGTLTAGPITLDGQKEPLSATLTVNPDTGMNQIPVRFSAGANTTTAYPGEMILYTVRVVDGGGLLDGQITTPNVANARVVVLNRDKAYQSTLNDRPVRVMERTYGIIPDTAGPLTIPATELYGRIGIRQTPGDLLDRGMLFNGLTGGIRDIRLETEPLHLHIRPRPADWSGWWLPATRVSLRADETEQTALKVGESFTRTVILTATGVTDEQLPTLTQPATDTLKVYPSPDKRSTVQTDTNDIVGVSETAFVLVPTAAGTITIPEIRVPWFNTRTGTTEVAILPQKTLTVLPSETAAETATNTDLSVPPPPPTLQNVAPVSTPEPTPPPAPKETALADTALLSPWEYGIIGICAGILCGLLGAWFFHRRHRPPHYRLPDEPASRQPQDKKPVPDLYPF